MAGGREKMSTLIASIAPQRSTQYGDLALLLAPHELQLCPAGAPVTEISPVELGGAPYLKFDLAGTVEQKSLHELGTLATLRSYFQYYAVLGDQTGPFLRPLTTAFEPFLPPDLLTTRRYKGKTNELFTHFLCNVAKFSSPLRDQPWSAARLFDPLCGGGTTLFAGLILGADVAGVEHDTQDVQTTAAFLRDYCRENRISCMVKEERLKKIGLRWQFTFGKEKPRRCILAKGETADSPAILQGFKPNLIVTDLPYGIQHYGEVVQLLTTALPIWAGLSAADSVLAFAWDATRFGRAEMVALVESTGLWRVCGGAPYDQLAHRVDRVIKLRDVIVAAKA
jgi:hypothetical protein